MRAKFAMVKFFNPAVGLKVSCFSDEENLFDVSHSQFFFEDGKMIMKENDLIIIKETKANFFFYNKTKGTQWKPFVGLSKNAHVASKYWSSLMCQLRSLELEDEKRMTQVALELKRGVRWKKKKLIL